MCLDHVKERYNIRDHKTEVAHQVMMLEDNPLTFRSLYQHDQKKIGKLHKRRNPDEMLGCGGAGYPSGFHSFRHKKDAIKITRGYRFRVVVEVLALNIRTLGSQYGKDIYVSDFLQPLRKVRIRSKTK